MRVLSFSSFAFAFAPAACQPQTSRLLTSITGPQFPIKIYENEFHRPTDRHPLYKVCGPFMRPLSLIESTLSYMGVVQWQQEGLVMKWDTHRHVSQTNKTGLCVFQRKRRESSLCSTSLNVSYMRSA